MCTCTFVRPVFRVNSDPVGLVISVVFVRENKEDVISVVANGSCSLGSRDLLRLDVVEVRETVTKKRKKGAGPCSSRGNMTGAHKQTRIHSLACPRPPPAPQWPSLHPSTLFLSCLRFPLLIAQHPLISLQASILNLFPDRTRLSFFL